MLRINETRHLFHSHLYSDFRIPWLLLTPSIPTAFFYFFIFCRRVVSAFASSRTRLQRLEIQSRRPRKSRDSETPSAGWRRIWQFPQSSLVTVCRLTAGSVLCYPAHTIPNIAASVFAVVAVIFRAYAAGWCPLKVSLFPRLFSPSFLKHVRAHSSKLNTRCMNASWETGRECSRYCISRQRRSVRRFALDDLDTTNAT